jgi:Tol biopolymer transport system component
MRINRTGILCLLICAVVWSVLAIPAGQPVENNFPSGVLAFSSVRAGNMDIYIINADGTDLRRVTRLATQESEPSWSPDGSQLAYQSQRPGWALYRSNLNGNEEMPLTTSTSWSPAWSPDGQWIAYSTGSAIYKISCTGEDRQILTQGGNCGRPAWSTDGQALVFHSTRSGNNEIYILDLESGEITQITNHPARDFQASWSPDGQRLVFASDRDGDLEIYTIRTDGRELVQITNNDVDDMLPAWSPDGAWIAFVSDKDGDAEITITSVDGAVTVRLTNNPGDDMYPAWKPLMEPES